MDRWTNKRTNKQKICYLFMVTNLPIWLVLNAVWIFLSLHTVMVKHAQCVYNVEKINKWCKRKRKKYISYLLAGIGLSKHCNLRIENDTFFMTTKWTQLLTIQISQLANNIIYTHTPGISFSNMILTRQTSGWRQMGLLQFQHQYTWWHCT